MITERFVEALKLAAELHATQVRKGSETPYIAHLLGAASIALENGADEDEAIAALLHDAVEDQGGAKTLELIRNRFGERVAEIVDGCTDTDQTPKPPWRARKEAYLSHLPNASASILLVSASDKLYNARAILSDLYTYGESVWSRFAGGREGSLWYYRRLADTLYAASPSPLTRELKRVVDEIEAVAQSHLHREQNSGS
jgi:(p)ppGpp synthase/HD superfamily hydrolase